jgi:hypothetical protein
VTHRPLFDGVATRGNRIWTDVVAPLLVTRALLVGVAWASLRLLRPNPDYPLQDAAARGWHFTTWWPLDIWARWDTGWYLDVIGNGYRVQGSAASAQSNFAFFPLYPETVKALAGLLPASARTVEAQLLIGVLLSNVLFLAALILLREFVAVSQGDDEVARRTVLYLLIFPTSFFFSCFYTESMFLFLSVAALFAASRGSWAGAGLLGGLAALTRPNGVLVLVPLLWGYLSSRGWKLRRVRWDVAWLAFVPAGLLSFLVGIRGITGDLLAPLRIQWAWGKTSSTPWETIFRPLYPYPVVTPIERLLVLAVLVLAVLAFRLLRDRSLAVYALVMLLPPLFTGVLNSSARYAAVVFPLFMTLAVVGEARRVDLFIKMISLALLVAAMAAWTRFYWVG